MDAPALARAMAGISNGHSGGALCTSSRPLESKTHTLTCLKFRAAASARAALAMVSAASKVSCLRDTTTGDDVASPRRAIIPSNAMVIWLRLMVGERCAMRRSEQDRSLEVLYR